MERIYSSGQQLVGNTPLLQLQKIKTKIKRLAKIFFKFFTAFYFSSALLVSSFSASGFGKELLIYVSPS